MASRRSRNWKVRATTPFITPSFLGLCAYLSKLILTRFEPSEEIKDFFKEPYFTWDSPGLGGKPLTEAKTELLDLIETEGPFDAYLGLSQGVALLTAVIIDHQKNHRLGPNLFRLTIFVLCCCSTSGH
jgi:hypothetical protein